jgi:hypothetical protein
METKVETEDRESQDILGDLEIMEVMQIAKTEVVVEVEREQLEQILV